MGRARARLPGVLLVSTRITSSYDSRANRRRPSTKYTTVGPKAAPLPLGAIVLGDSRVHHPSGRPSSNPYSRPAPAPRPSTTWATGRPAQKQLHYPGPPGPPPRPPCQPPIQASTIQLLNRGPGGRKPSAAVTTWSTTGADAPRQPLPVGLRLPDIGVPQPAGCAVDEMGTSPGLVRPQPFLDTCVGGRVRSAPRR